VLGPVSGGPNCVRTHLRVLKWEFNLISGDPSVLGSICIKIWSNKCPHTWGARDSARAHARVREFDQLQTSVFLLIEVIN
jgi:hypothetical protein